MPNDIPQELLISILSSLPNKSLLRLRCVCKSWNSLITSPLFINFHLHRTTTILSQTKPLIVIGSKFKDNMHYGSLRFDSTESLNEYLQIEFPCNLREKCFSVVGYCNGVICLQKKFSDFFFLWNPSINRCLKVQAPESSRLTAASFGYDSTEDDYKVVRFSAKCPTEVEIYSLNSRAWKSIDVSLEPCSTVCSWWCQTFVNGVVYWHAFRKVQNLIISFDLSHESFKEILLPECVASGLATMLSVSVLEDSLAVSVLTSDTSCDLWLMKEYGYKKSWTKRFSFKRWIKRAIAYRNNGELMIQIFGGPIASYNPKSQVIRDLESFWGYNYLIFVESYIESLVLLDQNEAV